VTYKEAITFLAVIAGVVLAAVGALVLFIAVSGDFVQGQTGAYVAGASCIAIATPLLLLPVYPRLATTLTFLALALFALGVLWTAFGSGISTTLTFRASALAFGVLLLIRVGLFLRRRRSGMGT
jgi:hypothetical protein